MRLSWPDYVVLAGYFALMIGLGVYGIRRQRSDDEYFLVGRRMPWLAVGISVVGRDDLEHHLSGRAG